MIAILRRISSESTLVFCITPATLPTSSTITLFREDTVCREASISSIEAPISSAEAPRSVAMPSKKKASFWYCSAVLTIVS